MTADTVHPYAAVFPMLDEDELPGARREHQDQRTPYEPILLDAHGRIVDGRNRFAACHSPASSRSSSPSTATRRCSSP